MSFHLNTAMVCYNCRRVAVVRLVLSWQAIPPVLLTWMGGESTMLTYPDGKPAICPRGQPDKPGDVLEVFFVSCAMCLGLAGVYNPLKAPFNKYIDPKPYASVIRRLVYIFGCPPKLSEQWKFLISSFSIKSLTKIRDVSAIFNIQTLPDQNIMILQDGEEVTSDCRFFAHEPYSMDRRIARYRYTSDADETDETDMPFASVPNKPPVHRSYIAETPMDSVCNVCLVDVRDSPPKYTSDIASNNADIKANPFELVGKWAIINHTNKSAKALLA